MLPQEPLTQVALCRLQGSQAADPDSWNVPVPSLLLFQVLTLPAIGLPVLSASQILIQATALG